MKNKNLKKDSFVEDLEIELEKEWASQNYQINVTGAFSNHSIIDSTCGILYKSITSKIFNYDTQIFFDFIEELKNTTNLKYKIKLELENKSFWTIVINDVMPFKGKNTDKNTINKFKNAFLSFLVNRHFYGTINLEIIMLINGKLFNQVKFTDLKISEENS